MDRNILTILANSMQSICAAAALALDAKSSRLCLCAGRDNWPLSFGDHSAVALSPITPLNGGVQIVMGSFVATETQTEVQFVTDLVDLHIDLLAENEHPIARLVLCGVPRNWKSKARKRCLDRLAGTLCDQLMALRDGPRIVASGMLALIEQLVDLDSNVNTPTLTGFLRVVSGKPPTRSQLIALQISGLVESHGAFGSPAEIMITDIAHDVMKRSGLGAATEPHHAALSQTATIIAEPVEAQEVDLQPHATLRIMERDYLIAEHPITEVLHYRAETEAEWACLSHSSADGWTKIAAEIIHSDVDVVAEFVKMHLIRRRDLPTAELAEAFEILGKVFWLRRAEAGIESCVAAGAWHALDVDPELPPRERAQAAALKLGPQMRISVDSAARDWADRMAQAVKVSPFLHVAAQ